MALSAVRELVQRLVADASFREKLCQNPDEVLKGYELTVEEQAAVLSMNTRHGFDRGSWTNWGVASQNWWAV